MTDQDLEKRVAILDDELELRHRFAPFSRLYGPLAAALVALSPLPPVADVTEHTSHGTHEWTFGSVWELAVDSGDVFMALLFLLVLITMLLVAASVRVRSTGLPVTIAVHAALLIVLLLVGTVLDPGPPLTDAGVVDVVLLCAVVITAVTHAIHLRRWQLQLPATPPQRQQHADGRAQDGGDES